MKIRTTIVFSVLLGAAAGVAAAQGIHAQAKPPAYVFTEFEILDQKALAEFSSKVAEVVKASGSKYLVRRGQIVPLEGDAPKLFTVQVFESLQKAQEFRNSMAWRELTPLRERALRQRSFIAEGVAN